MTIQSLVLFYHVEVIHQKSLSLWYWVFDLIAARKKFLNLEFGLGLFQSSAIYKWTLSYVHHRQSSRRRLSVFLHEHDK